MIVKIISAKKGRSSFRALADYICDKKHEGEKVLSSYFQNCNGGDSYELNLSQINFTQEANQDKRTHNKTMHIVISFAKDEKPDISTIRQIESELLKSIDLEHNQRLCAIHDNTDNLHLHIAINRVNPQTHKISNPSFTKVKLQKTAESLEERLNLSKTNHDKRRLDSNNQSNASNHISQTIQSHNKKSFLSWINQTAKPDILKVIKYETSSFKDSPIQPISATPILFSLLPKSYHRKLQMAS